MKPENFEYRLIVRWFNGRVTTVSAPSQDRALTLLMKKKQIHGRLIVWSIWKGNTKIKQGWK